MTVTGTTCPCSSCAAARATTRGARRTRSGGCGRRRRRTGGSWRRWRTSFATNSGMLTLPRQKSRPLRKPRSGFGQRQRPRQSHLCPRPRFPVQLADRAGAAERHRCRRVYAARQHRALAAPQRLRTQPAMRQRRMVMQHLRSALAAPQRHQIQTAMLWCHLQWQICLLPARRRPRHVSWRRSDVTTAASAMRSLPCALTWSRGRCAASMRRRAAAVQERSRRTCSSRLRVRHTEVSPRDSRPRGSWWRAALR
mmetsp:Transcript_101941/g.297285  ORF Transcript_101941/g.297285 Transcript_101941/m.297285 type:complete len:253 (-) Transcript_101941:74-832(-)